MSVRSTGASLFSTTVPTATGDWTIFGWFNVNTGTNGIPTHNQLSFNDSGGANPGLYFARDDGVANWNAYIWNGTTVAAVQALPTPPTGWVFLFATHASGSATYGLGWRTNSASAFTTATLSPGAQLTSINKLWLASDDGGESEMDASFRAFGVVSAVLTNAQLLSISQSPAAPGGALHFLPLLNAATVTTNQGTGGAWTPSGTWLNGASDPVFPGAELRTNRRAPGFPTRAPLPGIARIGVGLLVATTPTQQGNTGTGSAACQSFDATATGLVTFTGTGSAAASPFACDATGAFASVPTAAPAAQPQPQARLLYPIWRVAPPLLRLGSGFLTVSVATAPSFSGSGSAALSPFASSASGLETFTGTGSAALQPFAVTASGLVTFTGSGTAAMSPFAASASGSETFTGSAAAALAPFAASGSGLETFAASATAALSPFGGSAAGLETFTGTGSAALSPFDSLGFGSPPAVSWAASPQPQALGYPAKIRLRPLPRLNAGVLVPGLVSTGGSGSAALSPFGVSATGFVTFLGSATGAMSPFASSATGLETFTGSGSAAEAPFAASVAGAETFTGTASAACSPFAVSATGTSGNAFNGSASCAMSPFAVTASGLEAFSGTASAALSAFACLAAGLETFTGTGSAACQPFGAVGNGAQGAVFSGPASAAMSRFATSSAGAETFTGAGSCAARSFAVTGAGAEAFTGACSSALSPFGSSATGLHLLPITGTASCALSRFGASVAGIVLNPVSGTCTASLSPFNCNAISGVPFAVALARVRTARTTHLTSLSRRARITRLS